MKRLRIAGVIAGHVWALPVSALGFALFATVFFPAAVRWRDGAIEVIPFIARYMRGGHESALLGWLRRVPFVALTLGLFIFGRSGRDLELHEVHERRHQVQQFILGGLFLPLYLLDFLVRLPIRWALHGFGWRRFGAAFVEAYAGIWFEVDARRHAREELAR